MEAGAVGDEPLAALGVGGEEVAQVRVLDLGEVLLQRLPGGTPRAAPAPLAHARAPTLRLDRLQHLVPGLGEGLLALLLEALGERGDVDPGLLELRQHLLAVAAVGGHQRRRPRRDRRRRAGSARASC